jgi:hypothetical protein
MEVIWDSGGDLSWKQISAQETLEYKKLAFLSNRNQLINHPQPAKSKLSIQCMLMRVE